MTTTAGITGITYEGRRSVVLASQAWIVEEDRELAWAENHIIKNPAYKWILGKFVQTDQANSNGHIFALDELLAGAKDSVLYAPMNMLHKPRHIVGTYVANELVYPLGSGDGPASALMEQDANVALETTPYMETLAAFWKYYFPDEFDAVERAYKDGSLFFSMECVPDTVQCAMEGCDQEFEYKGRHSPTYCDHLNEPRGRRRLHQPHFTAGALIIPPIRPGWKNADVKELSSLIEQHTEECEMAYEQAKEMAPHLGPKEWEAIMAMLVQQAEKDGKDLKQHHDTDKNKPHAFQGLGGDGGVNSGAPCKKCGKARGAGIHSNNSDEFLEGLKEQAKEFAASRPSALELARQAARPRRSALKVAREVVAAGPRGGSRAGR